MAGVSQYVPFDISADETHRAMSDPLGVDVKELERIPTVEQVQAAVDAFVAEDAKVDDAGRVAQLKASVEKCVCTPNITVARSFATTWAVTASQLQCVNDWLRPKDWIVWVSAHPHVFNVTSIASYQRAKRIKRNTIILLFTLIFLAIAVPILATGRLA
jgi:hypothetical protein